MQSLSPELVDKILLLLPAADRARLLGVSRDWDAALLRSFSATPALTPRALQFLCLRSAGSLRRLDLRGATRLAEPDVAMAVGLAPQLQHLACDVPLHGPLLSRLSHLGSGCLIAAARFGESPSSLAQNPAVVALALECCVVDEAEAARIGALRLERLVVLGQQAWDAQLALALSPSLRTVEVVRARLTAACVAPLAGHASLSTVSLTEVKLGLPGAIAVADALRSGWRVRSLTLRAARLTVSGLQHIAAALPAPALEELDVGGNYAYIAVDAFAAALLRDTKLRRLGLSYCSVLDGRSLGAALRANNTLRELDLSGNPRMHLTIPRCAVAYAIESAPGLLRLSLACTEMRAHDLAIVARSLARSSLEWVDVSGHNLPVAPWSSVPATKLTPEDARLYLKRNRLAAVA